ncbi:MAG: PEGA domain-containing protein [Deltaproteobacteria bacterium]|nr:PEGA domain-containing protein [Deltaproteobacteria bacterium]
MASPVATPVVTIWLLAALTLGGAPSSWAAPPDAGSANQALLAVDDEVATTLRADLLGAARSTLAGRPGDVDDAVLRQRLRGPAGPPLDIAAVRVLVDDAEQAFAALEYERSLTLLQEAIARLQTDRDFSTEKHDLLEQLQLTGAVRLVALAGPAETGKAETDNGCRARALLGQVLRTNPSFRLDPRRHPPKMRALLALASDDVKQAGLGSLRVTSAPAGAQVFIDGRLLGTTPLALHEGLPAGQLRLWLEHGQDRSFARVIDVNAEAEVTVEVDVAFEGALRAESLQVRPSRPFVAADWRRLAGLLGVERIALVGVDGQGAGRVAWAAVLDGRRGTVLRGARVPLPSPSSSSSVIARLAAVLSGGPGDPGFVAPSNVVAAAAAAASRASPSSPGSPALSSLLLPDSDWPWVLVGIGVGVAVVVAAGAVAVGVWWGAQPSPETFSVTLDGVAR